MWTNEDMYRPDMLDDEGNSILGRERMTEVWARRLRERRSGGSETVSGTGPQEI
jgi:hypothetical protein